MQLVCDTCQLNFQAPDGAGGVVCPICRAPLKPAFATEDVSRRNTLAWDGGTLDELIDMLMAPAVAVRIEVFAMGSEAPAGEVHLLAGGINEAIWGGERGDLALDRLRRVSPARFVVEPRLPDPETGDLGKPAAEFGRLEERTPAALMRYCEEYVLTCTLEIWRGNESARIEYRKGEIGRTVVGNIDAPERLADVMAWGSGSWRIVVPRLALPDAPERTGKLASATPDGTLGGAGRTREMTALAASPAGGTLFGGLGGPPVAAPMGGAGGASSSSGGTLFGGLGGPAVTPKASDVSGVPVAVAATSTLSGVPRPDALPSVPHAIADASSDDVTHRLATAAPITETAPFHAAAPAAVADASARGEAQAHEAGAGPGRSTAGNTIYGVPAPPEFLRATRGEPAEPPPELPALVPPRAQPAAPVPPSLDARGAEAPPAAASASTAADAEAAATSPNTTTVPFGLKAPDLDGHRVTAEGLPVAIFDPLAPSRTTSPTGVPAAGGHTAREFPGLGADAAGSSSQAGRPRGHTPATERRLVSDVGKDVHERPRDTRHGFVAARPEIVLTRPPPTAAERRDAARKAVEPYRQRKSGGTAMRRRGEDAPIWVWVGLGFLLGLVVVGVYWLTHALAK